MEMMDVVIDNKKDQVVIKLDDQYEEVELTDDLLDNTIDLTNELDNTIELKGDAND